MTDKFLMFSLDDEKSKKLGHIISNPTCKKIIDILAEKKLSETDIANELKIPVNTVEYNLKKLLEAGIIEKAKDHFWSVKGKKIPIYQIANKLIVISPKKSFSSKLKNIFPVVIISGILTSIIAEYYRIKPATQSIAERTFDSGNALVKSIGPTETAGQAASTAQALASSSANNLCNFPQLTWEWFLIGSLITLIIFVILNWKRL